MKIHYLSAGQPIRKRYSLTARKQLKKTSYPNLYSFTSFGYDIESIDDFYETITGHAEGGNCLLKGQLQRELKNESRAGSTSPETLTQWVCLDFDGVSGFASVDAMLEAIGCGNTDYILQWSAGHRMDCPEDELHCHVFMMLEAETHPVLLKRWLKSINLSNSVFSSQISLAKSHNSVRWPLDITTCQNDKLLYIAPPIFEDGINDPLEAAGIARISLCKKEFPYLELDTNTLPTDQEIAADELVKLNELRKQHGLPIRKAYKFAEDSDTRYLVNPEPGQYTGIKTERGFVYFNLNGGDSWGYFHPVDNPAFIHNFKGEPVYRTQDLLPAYWEEIKTRVQNLEPDSSGNVYLAFRDFDSATYWNGIYSSTADRLTKLAQAKSESQLRHFMKQHGQPLGDFIPDWDMCFDPHSKVVVDHKRKKLNIYQPSQYFKRDFMPQNAVPPTIARVIDHALGSDPETTEHFLNWLAVIVQNLCMTQTAWVIHGTQGTGKGLLFHHILTPLFGKENVTSRRMEELGSDFTEYMKNKFVIFVDEVQAGDSLFYDKITAKLKNLIVEPHISVREMYRPSEIMRNYANLIFASNHHRPVSIAADDRRFNVGRYQPTPIRITSGDIQSIKGEVGAFYDYLGSRKADRNVARQPLHNVDRQRIIDNSRPSIDIAIEALKGGNLDFFLELLVDQTELISPKNLTKYDQYQALMVDLAGSMRTKISRDELMVIMRWCVDRVPDTPNKFTAMLRHHGLDLEPIWVHNKTQRGVDIGQWRNSKHAQGVAATGAPQATSP